MARLRTGSPVQLGIAILLGYFSIAVTFGAAGRDLGFSRLALTAFSVFVYAGASQFLAIQLFSSGVGPAAIIAATFILNARHAVMSLAIGDRIAGSTVPRPVVAFGITDEVFASAATRVGPIRDVDLLTMETLAYVGWVTGTITGFIIGRFLPAAVESAMGIALYAMFVSLIVPGILRFWRYGVVLAAAGALNWAMTAIGVPRGLALLIAIVVPAIIFGMAPHWSEPT